MKKLFIVLLVQDGENRHTHRVLSTCKDNQNVQDAAQKYAKSYYGKGEQDEFSNWFNFNAGSIAVKVENVRELSDFEYQLMSDIFSDTKRQKNYFEIVQAGYNEGLDREELQVHCGENGNMMIVKTPEGFVVDIYKQDDHVDTMSVWEDDLSPLELEITVKTHGEQIKEFLKTQGQKHSAITAELGLHPAHNMSDEILMDDYFFLEGRKEWYSKNSSMYSDTQQAIANFLRENRDDY
jgi:hypothetical protein